MRILTLLFLITTISFAGCKSQSGEASKAEAVKEYSNGNHTIDQADFAQQLEKLKSSGTPFYLLDVRTPEELQETGKIPGALNMDFRSGEFAGNIGDLDANLPILVYCRSGGRSGEAAKIMESLNFSLILNLDGGMNGWLEAGNAVEEVLKAE